MKFSATIILFFIFSALCSAQQTYNVVRDYKTEYTSQIYLQNDSTCFLTRRYSGNTYYKIYKGKIIKTNDTLYQFRYEPLVEFSIIQRFETSDSISTIIIGKDTLLPFKAYFEIKLESGIYTSFNAEEGWKKTLIKGASKNSFLLDTKFKDPVTGEKIYLSVNTKSSPMLFYYGSGTAYSTAQISIVKNQLTLFPDNKFIEYKDTYALKNKLSGFKY